MEYFTAKMFSEIFDYTNTENVIVLAIVIGGENLGVGRRKSIQIDLLPYVFFAFYEGNKYYPNNGLLKHYIKL